MSDLPLGFESAAGVQRRGAAPITSRMVKRTLDVGIAAFLLVLFSPVLVVICAAIKMDSRGPVFYRASRVGLHGRALHVLKFRKMREDVSGHPLTGHADTRFTRIGHFLSRTKVDELPQLWNVVRGQMSLVGPRPEDPGFVALHDGEYQQILAVRPGITGLGQLAFAREAEILDPEDTVGHYISAILPQKVRLDMLYAGGWTVRGDLRILAWTIFPVILRADVAVNRRTGTLTMRRRSHGVHSDSTRAR